MKEWCVRLTDQLCFSTTLDPNTLDLLGPLSRVVTHTVLVEVCKKSGLHTGEEALYLLFTTGEKGKV